MNFYVLGQNHQIQNNIENERVKWFLDDDELARRSFYSIQSIIAYGRCHCSGHAAKCRENELEENDNVRVF